MQKFTKSFLFITFITLTFFAWDNFQVEGKLLGVSNENQQRATVTLPPQAADQAVIALGESYDESSGGMVEGYAIIHREDAHAKGGNGGNKGGKPTGGSSCYEFMSSGMKWKNVEPWLVNTSNIDGLDQAGVMNSMVSGVESWETAAEFNILGAGQTTSDILIADLVSTDGLNEVYFANIDQPDVIGVTIVWGYFSGPPRQRAIVEWDQVYDDTDFDWTLDANLETNKMDFPSIATHELGHTVGMSDLYTQDCIEETMFGYGSEGQTHQRDLNAGDITGVKKLYK